MSSQRQPWWIILAILALFLAACGSTTSQHVATKSVSRGSTPSRSTTNPAAIPTQAGCKTGALGATMSGHLAKSCYRIPNLASGTYYLGIEAILSPRGAAAAKEGISVPPGHSGPAVSLAVSPSSVVPGAKVTITGRVSTPLSPRPGHTNICFDGCVDGLHYDGTPVHWISPTEFQTSFTTPSGPWLERYPLRLLLPKAGSYPVAIQCLEVHQACGLGHAEGSTTLTFTRSMTVAKPQLTLGTNKLLPGEMTPVKGTIPLTNIIGDNQPFVFEFDVIDQPPTKAIAKGVYQLPQTKPGTDTVLLGPVKFRVTTPLTYQSISLKGATNIQPSADPSIVTERGTSGVALTCSGSSGDQANSMSLFSDGHITVINTKGVATLLEQKGVPPSYLADNEPCSDLAALHTSTGKTLIAASYAIEIPNQAPNFAYLPVISTNDGATWAAIPSPSGVTDARFAGLHASVSGIHAYFAVPHHTVIAETTDNGSSWTQGSLRCPLLGPCILFSPIADLSNCAMNGAQEPVLVSKNEGRSFTQSTWPSSVNACGPNELFSVHGTEYLIDPQSSYPLRRSTDGGVKWRVVSDIPTPAGVNPPGTSPLGQTSWGQPTLVLPGSGDLLSIGSGIGSSLLAPHSHQWCRIPSTIIPKNVGTATTGEHSLYFVTYANSTTTTFTSIPLTSLHCAS